MSGEWEASKRQKVIRMAKTGMSAGQIAKRIGTTRNAVIGQISRHAHADRVPKDKQTAKSAGSAFFVGPSAPRRFSFQDLEE